MNLFTTWVVAVAASGLLALAMADAGAAQEPELSDSVVVRRVQAALASFGLEIGPIDGKLGPQTRAALRQFQRSVGLPIDGRLNIATASRAIELALGPTMTGGGSVTMEWLGSTFTLRDVERRCEVYRWGENWGELDCRSGDWERKVERDCSVWFPSPDGVGEIDCREWVLRPIARYCSAEMYSERFGTVNCARRQ